MFVIDYILLRQILCLFLSKKTEKRLQGLKLLPLKQVMASVSMVMSAESLLTKILDIYIKIMLGRLIPNKDFSFVMEISRTTTPKLFLSFKAVHLKQMAKCRAAFLTRDFVSEPENVHKPPEEQPTKADVVEFHDRYFSIGYHLHNYCVHSTLGYILSLRCLVDNLHHFHDSMSQVDARRLIHLVSNMPNEASILKIFGLEMPKPRHCHHDQTSPPLRNPGMGAGRTEIKLMENQDSALFSFEDQSKKSGSRFSFEQDFYKKNPR